MATKNLVSLGDAAGTVQADTAKTPNTIPLRDNAGGVAMGPSTFDQVTATIQTPAQHATVTTSTTADATAGVWPVDATSGAVTITLPAASGATNRMYEFTKIDSSGNNVVITDGTTTIATLSARYAKARVYSNGTIWF